MCETSNWISASWLRGHLGHSQRAVKRRWSTARGKLALVKRASITKKRRVFGKKRKYHVICGSPFGVVEAAVGSWIRQPTGQLFDGTQLNRLLGIGLSPDEDYTEQSSAHGSRTSAAAGEREIRGCDECCSVIYSPRPSSSPEGFIMERTVQGLGNTEPPCGGNQMARQLPNADECNSPLPSYHDGVECCFLGFFGQPMWYFDSTSDGNIYMQPEGADSTRKHRSILASTGALLSRTPLPAALFGHVAMFLGAEDVVALASVCKSLRWIAFHRDTWKALCFSAGVASYTSHAPMRRLQSLAMVGGKKPRCAKPSYVAHLVQDAQLGQNARRRWSTSDGLFRSDSRIDTSPHIRTELLQESTPSESSSCSSGFRRRCGGGSSDAALACEEDILCSGGHSELGIYTSTTAYPPLGAGTHCRGLQALPECTLHELVDWRFLFLLHRVSPGPRIHVHIRELELQFPMYPVVPDITKGRRSSTTGGTPTCDGQECGGGEQDKQRQFKYHARKRWLRPEEFVATFIRRALNISQPMRLRHLRQGHRPGLCVAEILREQHYLLEWQVPLGCLLEPSADFSFVSEAQIDSASAWPLPPYGSLGRESLTELGSSWRRHERMATHNVVEENRPRRSRHAPEVDAVYGDRIMFDVLDRGSVFASLLYPLSFGTTAAAIFVGAVLVAVAASSATAAITTAAAATATLAARRSRIFRVDLHVLERDEHEDDQEEVAECDASQSRLASAFTGSLGVAAGPLASSGCGSHAPVGSEAALSGSGSPHSCGPASTGSGVTANALSGASAIGNLLPGLPRLRQLFQDQLARLLRWPAFASAALTETSRALVCTLLSSVSRDAVTAASAVVAATCAGFTTVIRPPGAPGAGGCIPDANIQTRGSSTYICTTQKQRLPQGGVLLAPSAGSPPDAEVEGFVKSVGKRVDSSSPPKSMRLFKQLPSRNRGNPEQLQGKEGFQEMRRRGLAGDSAFLRSPPAAPVNPRRSQSFLSVCIGHFEALHRRSCCSMPARFRRTSEPCDGFGESGGSGLIAHRMRTLSTGPAALQHPQRQVYRPLWRRSRSASESNWETEREETLSSDQEHSRGLEMDGSDVTWTPTREFSEQNFGSPSSGWRLHSPPLQPDHGLLLFVRTFLPPETSVFRPRGNMKGYSPGISEWDAAAATSFTGLAEDVPLLLPADATVTDLLRLLFLTLVERKYMLPLISATPVAEPPLNSSHFEGLTDRPHGRRRKDRRGQTTHSSRVALLRFWLASTHSNREQHVEQPLPSAKLTADLRLMSCERLTLAVVPFSLARLGTPACASCLTLTVSPRGPPLQKSGRLPGHSTGVQRNNGITLPPCTAQQYPEDQRSPSEANPWLLSPLCAWTQGNTLSVETGTPSEGEPTLVLRREAALEPVCRTAESTGVCSQSEPCLLSETVFKGNRSHSCSADTEQQGANLLGNAVPVNPSPDTSTATEPISVSKRAQRIALREAQHNQRANIVHYSAGVTASTGTPAQRYAGIMLEEEDARSCKPWILQSSVNARQFEYHPAKSNVLLTGNNDGRVRVLDWKRDVILGTELVDSHPILALSWLKHHPELFVCAAGVSGIPYVVRWREQDDLFATELKGDRGRMSKASAYHSQLPLPPNMHSRQPTQQQLHVEAGDYETSHDDQYSGDRDECLDGSTVTAALTWFRRCGRGERLSREGTASLRIVHQYCAFEDLSSVSVNSTDDYLLVSGRSADLTIHDVATGARLGTLSGLHSDSINIVRFAHSSPHLFVTASFDQTCRLWDLRQRINGHQPLLTVDTGSLSVMCCFDDSDEWLLCSGVDAALRQVCLRSSTVFPETFAIPPVNAETNFRRAVYLQGGREFITAGTEEGFFRVFSRLGRDLGLVSLEGLLWPFIRVRSSQGLATLADVQAELLNLRIYLRSHMALGLSAMSDAALATAAGVSRSSVATVLRTALRHLSGGPTGLLDRELLDRLRQAVHGPGSPWFCIGQQGLNSESTLFQDSAARSTENSVVEEYVQSLRAHPQERRLVGALLATKDQVETANGEASYVAMARLPATMLG